MMKLITDEILNQVSDQALNNPRLRMNLNFHETLDEPIHRLLNALEPGTYLPPHRHLNPDKTETYIVIRGAITVAFFDDNGQITEKTELNPAKGCYGVEIPAGTWHSLVVAEPGTVIFEVKEGPYAPLNEDNLASWAPDPKDIEGINKFFSKILSVD